MIIAIVPALVALVGLLMWILSTHAKVSEAGRILFFCAALVLTSANHVVRIG